MLLKLYALLLNAICVPDAQYCRHNNTSSAINILNYQVIGCRYSSIINSGNVSLVNGCVLWMAVRSVSSGVLLRLPIWNQPRNDEVFDDQFLWELPTDSTSSLMDDNNRKRNPGM